MQTPSLLRLLRPHRHALIEVLESQPVTVADILAADPRLQRRHLSVGPDRPGQFAG